MDITPDIVSAFRAYYPGFADADDWPDATVTRYLEEADDETGKRWGEYGARGIKKRGMFAFAAHRLVLAKAADIAVANGGTPAAPARLASKSIGGESASFAVPTPSAAEQERYGDLLTTIYGLEFIRLRQRAAMGGVMV
ncbi:DUF4054 domain-containing protein [Billgrantia tianxiuensis]|uniref:DUF4054 domain-containing protein n=1 Tax=Billgrantia tianxiuensis TaxID=2497861 RepID=A0A6I6SIX5_9GAMM|nr:MULTISPECIES: DUF4054 domain-containing protein [Halomonas]MCE8034613.1 DUF4054 domain-containing protein [Halomonas sp. MCCC 1A11057]QHC50479.1 DUF4054 domain-containing protein [Halomonas tianxiuensis]